MATYQLTMQLAKWLRSSLQSIFSKSEKQVHHFTMNYNGIVSSLEDHCTGDDPLVCFEFKLNPHFFIQACLTCRHATTLLCLNHSSPSINIHNIPNYTGVAFCWYPCSVVNVLLITLHEPAKNGKPKSSTKTVGRARKSRSTAQRDRRHKLRLKMEAGIRARFEENGSSSMRREAEHKQVERVTDNKIHKHF